MAVEFYAKRPLQLMADSIDLEHLRSRFETCRRYLLARESATATCLNCSSRDLV